MTLGVPVAKTKGLRNGGKETWIMPTIHEGHYYTYMPEYDGLCLSMACGDYNRKLFEFEFEFGISELIEGELP